MSYKINYNLWDSVFAVPSIIIDKYLKFAGAAQLKVLLWILKNSNQFIDAVIISKDVGLSSGDVNDALTFWINEGIIVDQNPVNSPAKSAFVTPNTDNGANQSSPISSPDSHNIKPTAPKKQPEKNLDKLNLNQKKPDQKEVSKRAIQSQEVAFLLSESQNKFGRPISPAEASTLVWLCDFSGISASILLTVMEYAKSQNKLNMRYIEKVALAWADEDIDTLEMAEQKISNIRKIRDNWTKLLKKIQLDYRLPSPKEEQFITDWFINWDFSFDVIMEAYNICVDNTNKLSFLYINRLLKNWHELNLNTLSKIRQFSDELSQKNKLEYSKSKNEPLSKKSANSGLVESSINVDKLDDIIGNSVPVYKKKKEE